MASCFVCTGSRMSPRSAPSMLRTRSPLLTHRPMLADGRCHHPERAAHRSSSKSAGPVEARSAVDACRRASTAPRSRSTPSRGPSWIDTLLARSWPPTSPCSPRTTMTAGQAPRPAAPCRTSRTHREVDRQLRHADHDRTPRSRLKAPTALPSPLRRPILAPCLRSPTSSGAPSGPLARPKKRL